MPQLAVSVSRGSIQFRKISQDTVAQCNIFSRIWTFKIIYESIAVPGSDVTILIISVTPVKLCLRVSNHVYMLCTVHYITRAVYILQMKLSHIIFSPKQLCPLFLSQSLGQKSKVKCDVTRRSRLLAWRAWLLRKQSRDYPTTVYFTALYVYSLTCVRSAMIFCSSFFSPSASRLPVPCWRCTTQPAT